MNQFSNRRSWGPQARYENAINYKPTNNNFTLIAGPCSVEDESQINSIALYVSNCGATYLRGGVFRAGTYFNKNFGWVSEELMACYSEAAESYGLKNIIEILDYRDIDRVGKYCKAFQVGARQQQNYTLLKEVGSSGKTVFLKRSTGATVDEWLGSADQILNAGCKELFLIERGSSTFHNDTRWTACIHTIPSVKSICDIPVIFDASHSTGRRDLVPSMALAGVAAGAGGVLIETHQRPEESISDADQAIDEFTFKVLVNKINKVREAIK